MYGTCQTCSVLILTKEHGRLKSVLQMHMRDLSFLTWPVLGKSMADNEYKALCLLRPPFSCMLEVSKIIFLLSEYMCSGISGQDIEETGQVFPVLVLKKMPWFQKLATGEGVYV